MQRIINGMKSTTAKEVKLFSFDWDNASVHPHVSAQLDAIHVPWQGRIPGFEQSSSLQNPVAVILPGQQSLNAEQAP